MNKRGISHIEIMLSFLIFMGFVIFAFYFFSPSQTSRLVESSLDYTMREIIREANAEIENFYVKINVSGIDGNVIRKIPIGGADYLRNVRVENRRGEIIESRRDGTSGNVDFRANLAHDGNPEEGFALFKFSDDINPGTLASGGGQLEEWRYSIISSDKSNYVSEKRIKILNASYYSDYEGLKQQFNLPSSINFEFNVVFDSGEEIEAQREKPKGVEVFSDAMRIEILREDGNTIFADLIVRIW